MRILAVGTRFFPRVHAGDKTFWLAALRSMVAEGDQVRVLSIDTQSVPRETIEPGLDWQRLAAVPVYLGTGPHRDRYNPAQREIGAITNYASKSITMPRLFASLRAATREWEPDVIHFMDNLGPATLPFLLRRRCPTFVSAVTYDPRNPFYDLALRWSFEGFDGVAVSSDAFRARLGRIGVVSARLRTVRWGVGPEPRVGAGRRAELKRELGVDPDRPLVLWSGFLQQTTVQDYWTARRAVEDALGRGARFAALFCFKPQHYRDAYAPPAGSPVRATADAETFLKARACADLFLNPVTRAGSILAPPLTWVEVLMRAIPIVTTPCGGIDEVFGPGAAGRSAPPERLGALLAELTSNPEELERLALGAQAWAVEHFSLQGAVRGLRELWDGGRRG